ncbi:hypothetical protein BJY04DRAFT_172668 [Aspergillus karnatakaensis]|uniref:uncharacterized protein n=1 Tax=Aspergillus karnatakaensis TaxID=1810916 RepID=UPI003CCCB281
MKQRLVPFTEDCQLLTDIDGQFEDNLKHDTHIEIKKLKLPGHPGRCFEDSNDLGHFLTEDICTPELDLMAPRLWMMTTYSSSNINPLHFQRVKGREIVVTEYPRLHLTWKHSQVYIKPLPKYLLSFTYWDKLLASPSSPLLNDDREKITQAAKGLLRTYYYLVKHESDFHIAQESHLLPQSITWPDFATFIASFHSITDPEVSPRYHYGEIRLTRLNLYSIFFLPRSRYEWGRPQYSAYFNRFYGHILFVFALVSLLLSAMQVELAAESLVGGQWAVLTSLCRYFSVVCMLLLVLVAGSLFGVLLVKIGGEWVYTIQSLGRRRHGSIV